MMCFIIMSRLQEFGLCECLVSFPTGACFIASVLLQFVLLFSFKVGVREPVFRTIAVV